MSSIKMNQNKAVKCTNNGRAKVGNAISQARAFLETAFPKNLPVPVIFIQTEKALKEAETMLGDSKLRELRSFCKEITTSTYFANSWNIRDKARFFNIYAMAFHNATTTELITQKNYVFKARKDLFVKYDVRYGGNPTSPIQVSELNIPDYPFGQFTFQLPAIFVNSHSLRSLRGSLSLKVSVRMTDLISFCTIKEWCPDVFYIYQYLSGYDERFTVEKDFAVLVEARHSRILELPCVEESHREMSRNKAAFVCPAPDLNNNGNYTVGSEHMYRRNSPKPIMRRAIIYQNGAYWMIVKMTSIKGYMAACNAGPTVTKSGITPGPLVTRLRAYNTR